MIGEQHGEAKTVVFLDLRLHTFHRDEDGSEDEVGHEDGPEVDLGHVEFVAALGPVAEGEDEAGDKGGEVEPFERDGEDEAGGAEEVAVGEGAGEDAEDEEEVALQSHRQLAVYRNRANPVG